MSFTLFRASGAIILALSSTPALHAQESSNITLASTHTGGSSSSSNSSNSGSGTASSTSSNPGSANAAPDGPGLIVRSWRSATDWQAWQDSGRWRIVISPFSLHFRRSEEHRYVWAVGMEKERSDNWIAGFSYFSNSFGQPSSYAYMGKRFPSLFEQPQLFGQLSAGVMYGYRGKFQHKVPANYKGFSPGALVSMGWQFTPSVAVTAHLLGDAGMMLQLSYELK